MKLYLVQHGKSKTASEDPERPLTVQGTASVQKVAAWAGRTRVPVEEIRHSHKRRAEETAGIFAIHLDPPGWTEVTDGLQAMDDVEPWVQELDARTDPLMLVGHLPSLDRLASRLVAGEAGAGVVRFQNAGIVCLGREDDGWRVDWVMTEDLVE